MSNRALGIEHHATPRACVGKDVIDGLQHGRRGAEGTEQLDSLKSAVFGNPRLEVFRHGKEARRVGTLEGVDRLFRVADRKDRAGHMARAGACEELLRQRAHHTPLVGTGVLRLVDEDVVEAGVKLVEHPCGIMAEFEQADGARDEIGIIEHAALGLGAFVAGDNGIAGKREIAIEFHDARRTIGLHQRQEARLFVLKPLGDCG